MLQGEGLKQLITDYVENYTTFRAFSKRTLDNKRTLFQRFITFLGEKPLDIEIPKYIMNQRCYQMFIKQKKLFERQTRITKGN